MPVFHLTLHAYATWMPDREQGSVHWRRGYQTKSDDLADSYRANQREPTAHLTAAAQRTLVNTLRETCVHKVLRLHAAATDPSHLHAICSWEDAREAECLRDRLKHALTLVLNRDHHRRTWFTRGGDCRRVWNRGHLDYLMDYYLPSHAGLRWDERSLSD